MALEARRDLGSKVLCFDRRPGGTQKSKGRGAIGTRPRVELAFKTHPLLSLPRPFGPAMEVNSNAGSRVLMLIQYWIEILQAKGGFVELNDRAGVPGLTPKQATKGTL